VVVAVGEHQSVVVLENKSPLQNKAPLCIFCFGLRMRTYVTFFLAGLVCRGLLRFKGRYGVNQNFSKRFAYMIALMMTVFFPKVWFRFYGGARGSNGHCQAV
jgi:hypothetical protein